ncbi:MAG: hypothetical protein QOI06_235 [Nocardioidaceae bacterium]|nr:hypothetical protein [Nocardioidaceae bacterium]
MTAEFSEADMDAAIARAFGRRDRRQGKAGEAQLEVRIAEAFGRDPAAWAVEEVERGPAASPGDPVVAGLVQEVAVLARTKLGLSEARANLHAQSEALAAREFSPSVAEAVVKLRAYRDQLRGGVSAGRAMSDAELDRVIEEAFRRQAGSAGQGQS